MSLTQVNALSDAPPQCASETVGRQGVQGVELLPDRGQVLVLEHDHELPVVLTTAAHQRAVGIEPIEQQQNRQTGE